MSETLALAIIATDHMLCRIRGEYLEMPGLRLTHQQAQRLWGLDQHTCGRLLDVLVEAKFLRRTDDGMYARMTDGLSAAPPLRMAAADISRLSARTAVFARRS
jgi:DNA-binding IclR family transcriptional regulator